LPNLQARAHDKNALQLSDPYLPSRTTYSAVSPPTGSPAMLEGSPAATGDLPVWSIHVATSSRISPHNNCIALGKKRLRALAMITTTCWRKVHK